MILRSISVRTGWFKPPRGRLRQEDLEFHAGLDYTGRPLAQTRNTTSHRALEKVTGLRPKPLHIQTNLEGNRNEPLALSLGILLSYW